MLCNVVDGGRGRVQQARALYALHGIPTLERHSAAPHAPSCPQGFPSPRRQCAAGSQDELHGAGRFDGTPWVPATAASAPPSPPPTSPPQADRFRFSYFAALRFSLPPGSTFAPARQGAAGSQGSARCMRPDAGEAFPGPQRPTPAEKDPWVSLHPLHATPHTSGSP